MERQQGAAPLRELPASVPRIEPVSEIEPRPLWSVMIPTYNCASYLRQTLQSVLSQDPGPHNMQIEVVDDCSTRDDPESVVNEVAHRRVTFFRQPKNVGLTENFNTCLHRSRGMIVHILHGDDYVLPGFYEHMAQPFAEASKIGAAACRYIEVDPDSHWLRVSAIEQREAGVLPDHWLDQLAIFNRFQFCSMAVARCVYERLGGFCTDLAHATDWEMWRRIAFHYPLWFDPAPLACYRVHPTSDTSRLLLTGANIQEYRRSIDIASRYLPVERAKNLTDRARQQIASYAIHLAGRFVYEHDNLVAARAQIREAFRSSHSIRTYRAAGQLIYGIAKHRLRKTLKHILGRRRNGGGGHA